ncbi:MAG: hypothetical protein IJB84_02795 [Lachnospiraceae bacterium]|nr:hypothetical protein [Lachnospiraceae bacterium]
MTCILRHHHHWSLPDSFFKEITERTVKMAQTHHRSYERVYESIATGKVVKL